MTLLKRKFDPSWYAAYVLHCTTKVLEHECLGTGFDYFKELPYSERIQQLLLKPMHSLFNKVIAEVS